MDALREVGNIGAGHAATALSQIIGQTILIAVSKVKIVPLKGISQILEGPKERVVAVYLKVLGDVVGGIVLLLRHRDALSLTDFLQKKAAGTTKYLSEIENSALKESGTILSSSYLRAIGGFIKMSLIPAAPNLTMGETEIILNSIFSELSRRSEIAFCIETEFIESNHKINGHFLLIPEINSLELILKALGLTEDR
jgi:chemotaxis protein CheC